MGHIEISVKGIQVRYHEGRADKYKWSFAGHKEDRLLVVWNLNGIGFYSTFRDHYKDFFKNAEIDCMLCTMTIQHADYFKKVAKDLFKINDFGPCGPPERPMRFLLVRMREIK